MLQTTLALARRIDLGEIDFCAAVARAGEAGGAASIEVAGGRGLCGPAGSPFNKVLGLGLGVPATDADLDAIDAFYDERGVPGQIELCPLAAGDLASRLNKRGYVLQGFENQLARALGTEPVAAPRDVEVSLVGAAPDGDWLRVVSHGFAAGEAHPERPVDPVALASLGDAMRLFAHPEIDLLVARLDGEAAGGGGSFIRHGLLLIFGTATVPACRRRGVQSALVAYAINQALGRADLATATTEPGSVSQRTFERFGFQVLYTRAIFARP